MDWIRGESIGHGSSSTVSLAYSRGTLMAVKSCESSSPNSKLLENEKRVLTQLGDSPQIVGCFGLEKAGDLHNLFLEYASGGSVADRVKKSAGGKLPEFEARGYARSILKGLSHIHGMGFVHCDIKLQNLLVFDDGEVKIADFGLAKKTGDDGGKQGKWEIRGTPLFMAPESVSGGAYSPASDVWGLGCAVAEMLTGKSVWEFDPGMNIFSFLARIGAGDQSPAIRDELSGEAKDFLSKCFVKDPSQRWTAEMLLSHPFAGEQNCAVSEERSVSPRCPFDFPEWVSVESGSEPSPFDLLVSDYGDRIKELASGRPAAGRWEDSGSWLVVR